MKTTSQELSRRLAELGLDIDSEAMWAGESEHEAVLYTGIQWRVPGTFPKIWIKAYTTDDLLGVLPDGTCVEKINGTYDVHVCEEYRQFNQKNPAEALGELYEKLLIEGVI